MATPQQSSDNIFYLHVDKACSTPAPTCTPDTRLDEAARRMRALNSSALFVCRDQHPLGMITLEDLRDLVAERQDPSRQNAAEVMREVVTVHGQDYVFDAIYRMAKHNTEHLAVLDEEDGLYGIITDSDLLRFQTRSPLYTTREIESAQTIGELRDINLRMLEIVKFATSAGADIKALVQLISHLNDTFTRRVITLLEEQEGLRLPEGSAYLALGSEGRNEQTLRTDQDSAIIYRDDLDDESLAAIETFSVRLVEALEEVGVPRCPGNTMVSNPNWRRSLQGWKELLEKWITVPKPEHMVDFGMFQDFRSLHGDPELEQQLRGHLLGSIRRHTLFLPYMARHITRFPPPLGFFGRFKTERGGRHRGSIDLKKAGIFAITEGISLLALEAGMSGGNTWEKMDRLRDIGSLTDSSYKLLYRSFSDLSQLRLARQLQTLGEGKSPSNHVTPMLLSRRDQDRLRDALRAVNYLLRMIRDRYRLDLISR